jgi:hypothetical protein
LCRQFITLFPEAPMQRNEMFDIVKERIHALVTELPPAYDIQEHHTWRDLHADALDVVMITSDAIKRVGVLVDHTELRDVLRLSELLDMFERALERKQVWLNQL